MNRKTALNAYQIKIIAVIAMIAQHSAIVASEALPASEWVYWPLMLITAVSRITMPIMCFFIAEGYFHTRSFKKYLTRLLVFAVISQIPYFLFRCDVIPANFKDFAAVFFHFNVLFTLALGLITLRIYFSPRLNAALKTILIIAVILASRFCEYSYFGIMWVLAFGVFYNDRKKQFFAFGAVTVFRFLYQVLRNALIIDTIIQFFALSAVLPLFFYNGKIGKKSGYLFYIIYPAHLLVLGLIRLIMHY